jgi:hypothetical protein
MEIMECTPDPTWQERNKFLPFPVICPSRRFRVFTALDL